MGSVRHMTTTRIRGAIVVGVAALVGVGASGCSDTGKVTVGKSVAQATTTVTEEPTTTERLATTTSTPPDDDLTTTTGGADSSGGGGSAATSDQDAVDVSWSSSPGEFRGQDGLKVAYECPAGGTIHALWGTGPFTDDSSVCTAGVFVGLITFESGGRVVIEIAPGATTYEGATAHGVESGSYGSWGGSFEVLGG